MSNPEPGLYTLRTTPTVRRALSERLPEAVAVAAHEFMTGPLVRQPYRVGKRLAAPLDDRFSARRGTYRIIYRVDDDMRTITVVDVDHRRDIYHRYSIGTWAGRERLQAGVWVWSPSFAAASAIRMS